MITPIQFAVPMQDVPRLAFITTGSYNDGTGDKQVISFYGPGDEHTSLTKFGGVLLFLVETTTGLRSGAIRDVVVAFDCRFKGLYN